MPLLLTRYSIVSAPTLPFLFSPFSLIVPFLFAVWVGVLFGFGHRFPFFALHFLCCRRSLSSLLFRERDRGQKKSSLTHSLCLSATGRLCNHLVRCAGTQKERSRKTLRGAVRIITVVMQLVWQNTRTMSSSSSLFLPLRNTHALITYTHPVRRGKTERMGKAVTVIHLLNKAYGLTYRERERERSLLLRLGHPLFSPPYGAITPSRLALRKHTPTDGAG